MGWVALVDHPGLQVAAGDGAEAEDGSLADGDAGADGGIGGNPGAVADGYGGGGEGKVGVAPVVVAGAEVGPLGDADVGSYSDGGDVVEPGLFTEPGVIAKGEPPGEFNFDAGLNADALPDASAK